MKIATGLGGLVGCDAKESKPLVECLREVPADDLVNVTTYQVSYLLLLLDMGSGIWKPNSIAVDELFYTGWSQSYL